MVVMMIVTDGGVVLVMIVTEVVGVVMSDKWL